MDHPTQQQNQPQQQQQSQQPQQSQTQPQQTTTNSPIRGVAAATANAALLTAASNAATTTNAAVANTTTNMSNNSNMAAADVTRTISAESHDSHSIGTGTIGSTSGVATAAGGGAGGGGGGDCGSTIASHRSGSFRTSPLLTSVAMPGGMNIVVPPFPTAGGGGSNTTAGSSANATGSNAPNAPPVGVAPPPWPTSSSSSQQQPQPQLPTGRPSPTRSASPHTIQATSHDPQHEGGGSNTPSSNPFTTPTTTNNNNNNNPTLQQSAGSGPAPPPPMLGDGYPQGSLSLSMTKSGDTLFSGGSNVTSSGPAGTSANANSTNNTASNTAVADTSVLLGLEELERQQANAEKRKAERLHAEQQQHQQHQHQQQHQQQQPPPPGAPSSGPRGLPPLAPGAPSSSGHPPRPLSAPNAAVFHARAQRHARHHSQPGVPSQIHLNDEDDADDDDTLLSSDAAAGGSGGGNSKGDMKRVVSIEKLKGSVTVSLRRLRSWSQDALNRSSIDNPAPTNSSTDSTLNATAASRASNDGGGRRRNTMDNLSGGGVAGGGSGNQQKPVTFKSSNKKVNTDIISEPYLDDDELKPLIYGYLRKLGRNGHWQKRFFETNGERLTYYKSVKRTKVLATLDLCKVGEIAVDRTDPEECTFTIQVKNRPYYLRAEDKARCNDWVIILNRAREARMNVGNIQLVTPEGGGVLVGPDGLTHRSQAGSDDYAPCIVISALRPRTRALMDFEGDLNMLGEQGVPDLLTSNTAEDEQQIEVMNISPAPSQQYTQGVVGVFGGRPSPSPSPSPSPVAGHTMAKWEKRHSKMHMLSLRFLKWARSITNQADVCRKEVGVVVVPAHVVTAAQQTRLGATSPGGAASPDTMISATGSATTSGSSATGAQLPQQQQQPQRIKHKSNPSGNMPNLMEETQQEAPSTPGTDNPDSSGNNRSRANTESPAFGSTYV